MLSGFWFSVLISNHTGNDTLYNKMRIGLLVFDVILSRIVLRTIIYKHQVLAIVMMLIGMVMVSYKLFINEPVKSVICFVAYLSYALYDIQIKRLSRDQNHSVYKVIFVTGLMSIIIYVILFIIYKYI